MLWIASAWLAVIGFMFCVWGLFLWNKNPGIIDVAWGLAIMICGLFYACSAGGHTGGRIFSVLLVIWALRLSLYLFITRVLPGHVDKRYVEISESWNMQKRWGFLINFQFQGLLCMGVAIPFLFLSVSDLMSVYSMIGILLIVLGIIGESVADWQLQTFRRDNPGQICDKGLWGYSRHPNYFFESIVWFGFAVAALPIPWGWFAMVSPMLLLFIMFYLTIPITERSSLKAKGDRYREYQRKTAMFLLLPRGKKR